MGRIELLTPILSATFDRYKINDRNVVHLLTTRVNSLDLNLVDVINRISIKKSCEAYRPDILENSLC